MFIVIDGIDGAGKTTLAFHLEGIFKKAGFPVLVTKEPTFNSPWAQQIREAATKGRLSRDVELDLFHKDRLFHIDNLIRPSLLDGKIVICDRYVDSTLAYQATDPREAEVLYERFKNEIIIPDFTFILNCPLPVGFKRLKNRDGDNLSKFETVETLERAKEIFESRKGPNYFHIDASKSPEDTLSEVKRILARKNLKLAPVLDKHAYVAMDEKQFVYA